MAVRATSALNLHTRPSPCTRLCCSTPWMRQRLAFQIARPLLRAAAPAPPQRCFSTSLQLAIDQRRVAGKIQIKTIDDKIAEFPLNEKIVAHKVKVKNADGKLSEPQWLDQLLDS